MEQSYGTIILNSYTDGEKNSNRKRLGRGIGNSNNDDGTMILMGEGELMEQSYGTVLMELYSWNYSGRTVKVE